jgi:hypothetical protein
MIRFLRSLVFRFLCFMFPDTHVCVGPSNITTEKDTVPVVDRHVESNPEIDSKVHRLGEIENELSAWQELLKLMKRIQPTSPLK